MQIGDHVRYSTGIKANRPYETLLGVGTVRYISAGGHARNIQVKFETRQGEKVLWMDPEKLAPANGIDGGIHGKHFQTDI